MRRMSRANSAVSPWAGGYDPGVDSGAVVRPEPADEPLAGGPYIEPRGDSLAAVRSLLVGVGLVMACNGLLRVTLGVRAEQEDFGLAVTGLVMASYFLGFLFGTKAAEYFIATVGHIRVFAALAALGSTASVLHVTWVHPVSWTLLRLGYGLCLAGILVTVESWLNDMAPVASSCSWWLRRSSRSPWCRFRCRRRPRLPWWCPSRSRCASS